MAVLAAGSVVVALLIMLKASGGHEIGCALAVVPIIAFAIFMAAMTIMQFVAGWNVYVISITNGECYTFECLHQWKGFTR